jgi:presenilin-like A22 family membrane protease
MLLTSCNAYQQFRVSALTKKFNANAIYLVPILASLLFGLGCASLLLTRPVTIYTITPFPENAAPGPFGNALYFVIIVAAGASVFYLLLRMRNRRVITFLTALALTAASLLSSVFYLSAILFSVPNSEILVSILSIIVTAFFDLAVYRLGSKARNTVVVCLGGALGVFFGASIPVLSSLLILCFLAIYDVFAVYYGPLGKIAHAGLDQLKGLSISFREVQMGLGDLVFYSMLSGSMLLNFGVVSYLVSLFGILFGSFLTFVMLEKKGVFPGLPFPIFFGLAAGLLASFVV